MARKILRFGLGFCAAFYLFVLFPFLAPMSYNDIKFNHFCSEVSLIPLPPKSELLFKNEDFGLLWGSSNGCYHQVRLVIASELGQQAVRRHYAQFTVPNPDEEDDKPVAARVIVIPQEPEFEKLENGAYIFYPLFPLTRYNWFIVEFQGTTEQGLDLRCS